MSNTTVVFVLSDDYEIERAVYLSIYAALMLFGGLQLRADWARQNMKKTLNVQHVRQHCLQFGGAFLGLLRAIDPSNVYGIYPPWAAPLITGIASVLCIGSLQISAYVLAAGHYAMLGHAQAPRWLMYPFWITICVFAAIYLPLIVAVAYLGVITNLLRTLTGIDILLFILVDLIVLDVSFCRIRRAAVQSDNNAASTNKIMPRMRKAARTVCIVNVVFLAIGVFLMVRVNSEAPGPDADGSYNLNISPGVILALLVTQWWTYHPLFPRVKEHKNLASRTTTNSRTRTSASSRPSSSRPTSRAASPRGSQSSHDTTTANVCVPVLSSSSTADIALTVLRSPPSTGVTPVVDLPLPASIASSSTPSADELPLVVRDSDATVPSTSPDDLSLVCTDSSATVAASLESDSPSAAIEAHPSLAIDVSSLAIDVSS
jgi:hypothetical protein